MNFLPPINYQKWIHENQEYLKPPVGNKLIYQDSEFIIMTVGGPNKRSDFHVNEGDEFFYQVKGDISLSIIEDEKIKHLSIKEGEMFLLPKKVPHSPQRPAESIGLVIERKRKLHELDGFQWYCSKCNHLLYEEYLHISDIINQLPPIFDRFYSSKKHTTCAKCGLNHEKN